MVNLSPANEFQQQLIETAQAYLVRQSDVVVAYLFGSVARDEQTLLSDIDIAVLLDAGMAPVTQVECQLQLMRTLDVFDDVEVQITLLNNATPLLAYQVIKDGILLYQRSQRERVDCEVHAMKRYFDVKPMLDFQNQAFLNQLQEVGLGRRRRHPAGTLEAARQLLPFDRHGQISKSTRSRLCAH